MYFEEIMEAAAKFKAQFKIVDSFEQAADLINKPHEDYPKRVPKTLELIKMLVEDKGHFVINKSLTQNIHHALFSGDLQEHMVEPGFYRTHSVGFDHSDYVPPDAIYIEYQMNHLFSLAERMTPGAFYRHFQCIHPFSDGNGRVGGILLTVKSFIDSNGEQILAPMQ